MLKRWPGVGRYISARPCCADRSILAAPDERANCVALLTAHFGPQGLVDDAAQILRALAAARGMTFGELAAMLARERGTVEECLVVLGLPPVQP